MYVRIRTTTDTIVVVESILSKIEDLRKSISKKLKVEPKLQRLFHGGKLLENGYTLHDYNIKLNDVIQLMIMQNPVPEIDTVEKTKTTVNSEEKDNNKTTKKVIYKDGKCKMFSVGDIIDMCDEDNGAWYEGKILSIVHKPDSEESTSRNEEDTVQDSHKESDMLYKIQFDMESEGKGEDNEEVYCELKQLRPRARRVIALDNLEVGQTVMLNYNIEEPTEKGNWYDFKVDGIEKDRKGHKLRGILYVGKGGTFQIEDVKVHDKIFAIEELIPVEERTEEQKTLMTSQPEKRSTPLRCLTCRDNEDISCKDCGCYICRGKENPDKIMLCDECDQGYHMDCLTPPLTSLPEGDWYCPDCKRDTKAVVAPGASKQKKKASTSKTTRDWGRGMACVGKTKVCLLPLNHFGEIPGIEVGMCWRYRIQLSESGVHRPPVSGIHGRDTEGAYSIVLSGGYEDDVDNGEEFTYTGSGGRDLSGNKRTAEQSCDQTLTRENRALARNCAVKDISEEGGDAGDKWREGKPVRVVRSFKMLRHFPKYAPKEGIRYDGLYKVVKYYPEKGLSGFRVWKYLLRRDDPSPAPWEKGAKQFPVVYPEGYLEAEQEMKHLDSKNRKRSLDVENKEPRKKKRSIDQNEVTSPGKANKSAKKKSMSNAKLPAAQKITNFTSEVVPAVESMWNESDAFKNNGKAHPEGLKAEQKKNRLDPKNRKRGLDVEDNEPRKKRRSVDDSAVTSSPPDNKSAKKKTTSNAIVPVVQKITNAEMDVIRADQLDSDLWNECLETFKSKGRTAFMDRLGEVFRCVICQEVCCNPVTTPCSHVYCMRCLKLAFKSSKICPCCRGDLRDYEPESNEKLKAALRLLLPGYDAGRR